MIDSLRAYADLDRISEYAYDTIFKFGTVICWISFDILNIYHPTISNVRSWWCRNSRQSKMSVHPEDEIQWLGGYKAH